MLFNLFTSTFISAGDFCLEKKSAVYPVVRWCATGKASVSKTSVHAPFKRASICHQAELICSNRLDFTTKLVQALPKTKVAKTDKRKRHQKLKSKPESLFLPCLIDRRSTDSEVLHLNLLPAPPLYLMSIGIPSGIILTCAPLPPHSFLSLPTTTLQIVFVSRRKQVTRSHDIVADIIRSK